MKFVRCFVLFALLAGFVSVQGCKKDETKEFNCLDGSISLSLPPYVEPGYTKTFTIDTLMHLSRADGGKIGYAFRDSGKGVYDTLVTADIKYHEFCDVCIPLLLSKNLGDRLVVQSFDTRSLEYIHEKWPQVILSYLTDQEPDIEEIMANLSFKPQWWSPNYKPVTPENVAWCHRKGIKVVPWTVDDPDEIRRMVDCGVDAIISNYPDRLIEICRAK